MQGGQGPSGEPGRGVYVARRIVAALVILLLLALLVPQACQALLGSGEEPGSGTQDTSDVGSSGGGTDEESTTTEETTGSTEDQSGSAETGVSDGARSTSGRAEVSENEEAAVQNIGLNAEPAATSEVFVAEAVSEVAQSAPPPTIDTSAQQAISPIVSQEPIVPAAPIVPAEPIVPSEPVALQTPVVPAELIVPVGPIVPAEPLFFDESFSFKEPRFFDESLFFEQPVFEQPVIVESVAPDASGAAVSKAAGEDEGGSGAYAAVTPDHHHRGAD